MDGRSNRTHILQEFLKDLPPNSEMHVIQMLAKMHFFFSKEIELNFEYNPK